MSIRFPIQRREVLDVAGTKLCANSQVKQNASFWMNPPQWDYNSGKQDVYDDTQVSFDALMSGGIGPNAQGQTGAFWGVLARPMTRLRLHLVELSSNIVDPLILQLAIVAGDDENTGEYKGVWTFQFPSLEAAIGAELVQIAGGAFRFWGVYARLMTGIPTTERREIGLRFVIDNAGANTASSQLFPAGQYNNLYPNAPPGMPVAVGPYFVSSP